MRSLSPDEAALWAKVTETIRPLSREAPLAADKPVPPTTEPNPPRVLQYAPKPRPAPVRPRPAIGATLDGSWDRVIASGRIEPDRIVDLHGMNLDGAWNAIDRSLESAIAARERVLLLITGHLRPGEAPVARGKIRAAVHDWLAVSRHSGKIAAVRGGHRRHGGGGSLYIILRRG